MPWYKLPHADLVMHFDQEMDMEPADDPARPMDVTTFDDAAPRFIPAPDEEVAIERGQDPGQIHASTLAKLLHLRSKVADKKTDKRTEAT